MKVSDLFNVHIAKSHAFKRYEQGDAAFATNGFKDNGIQGFVKPLRNDRVFKFTGICISAFCEATVQSPPFLGRGNGGSGMIVLERKHEIPEEQLLLYAAYFNKFVRWRFSYGRMVTKDRIVGLEMPSVKSDIPKVNIEMYLPEKNIPAQNNLKVKYGSIPLTSLFILKSGDYHNAGSLPEGTTPLVSCGDKNNGVMKFVKVPKNKIYGNALTIAYNGQPLTTKYHPYKFATKDDVAVCIPKLDLKRATLTFIQFIITSERWRFSFGRKCFREKLSQMQINLPVDSNGKLDEDIMEKCVENTSYWNFLNEAYESRLELTTDIVDRFY